MGWALAAAIGASFAHPNRNIICVTGDGSLQLNIQELATIIKHNLPIKIILLNNHGHGMIQQTQDQWLDSKYLASSVKGGLASPDFCEIAKAYGFNISSINSNSDIKKVLKIFYNQTKPSFCNIDIDSNHRVIPQVKFGYPNEDSDPLLSRDEFNANMIINPISIKN
jgi:acetolactate synthase-1/2/3 large subunit